MSEVERDIRLQNDMLLAARLAEDDWTDISSQNLIVPETLTQATQLAAALYNEDGAKGMRRFEDVRSSSVPADTLKLRKPQETPRTSPTPTPSPSASTTLPVLPSRLSTQTGSSLLVTSALKSNPSVAKPKPPSPPGPIIPHSSANSSATQNRPSPSMDYEAMELTRKRKREDEEQWQRRVLRKLEDERTHIQKMEDAKEKTNRELYSLFNDLQGISADFNISFNAPELVVVGMQSDGKSTFIEALLGFQFNIVDTNIGTRRPLIIQMINDPARNEPYCRFRKENVSTEGEDAFEDRDVPAAFLSTEIVRRTEAVCGTSKDKVSPKPIILRVEFKNCANLTVYDTPGFRLAGDDGLNVEIERMVKAIMQPPHRIIVCLEQSTVEWANTVSRPLVKQLDASFSRTVLVNTKFDNRVKELRDPDSSSTYLLGEGLPPGVKPFFVSMPVHRNLEPRHFKEAITECYLSDYRTLLSARFDEEKFGYQIGFFRLKEHLERLLRQKYKESLIPTLQLLEKMCNETKSELIAVRTELEQTDIETQKSKVNGFVGCFVSLVQKLLEGSVIGDPDRYGLTLGEEKVSCGSVEWPNFSLEFPFQNADLKLYGGAQYERLLNEFEFVAHSIEFPKTSINEVASALGTAKSHNAPLFEAAASDIVQTKAKKTLLPLIQIVLTRCTFIMNHLFDIAVQVIVQEEASSVGIIGRYEEFIKELRQVYEDFVKRTCGQCESKSLDDFVAFTKILDWDLMSGLSEITEYDYLNCTKEDTKARVEAIMGLHRRPQLLRQGSRSRVVDEETYHQVLMMAGKLFAGVRYFFTKYIRSKFNAFFLDPMFQQLVRELTDHFRKMSDDHYEELFNMGIASMKQRAETLQLQLEKFTIQRNRFREVVTSFKKLSDSPNEQSHLTS